MQALLCVLRHSPAPLSNSSPPGSPLRPLTTRNPKRTLTRTPNLTPTLMSHLSLPAALAPAPRRLSPALPLVAHARDTVSLVPALASSSTVVAPAAATPTPLSAPRSLRTKSTINAPPAARVSSSGSRYYLLPSCSDQHVCTATRSYARGDNIAEIRTYPTLVARSFHFPPIVWLIFCHWSYSFPTSQGLQLACLLSCHGVSEPGCTHCTPVNPAMKAALRCLARRPAAREGRTRKAWGVYRLRDVVGRPVYRASMEACLIDKNGYDACCVRSSSSPADTERRWQSEMDFQVRARPSYNTAKFSSDQIKISSTAHVSSVSLSDTTNDRSTLSLRR